MLKCLCKAAPTSHLQGHSQLWKQSGRDTCTLPSQPRMVWKWEGGVLYTVLPGVWKSGALLPLGMSLLFVQVSSIPQFIQVTIINLTSGLSKKPNKVFYLEIELLGEDFCCQLKWKAKFCYIEIICFELYGKMGYMCHKYIFCITYLCLASRVGPFHASLTLSLQVP